MKIKNPTVLFFTSISFKHPLSGSPEALLRILSGRGIKTGFVEIPSSCIGFLKNLFLQRQNIWKFLFPKVKIIENIIVVPSLPILPFGRLRLVRNINKIVLGLWLRNALASLENKIAIIITPWWYPVIKYLGIKKIYYDCLDDISVFCVPGEVRLYRELERELIGLSETVFAITPTLKAHILDINSKKKTVLLPNGVDTNWFKINTLPVPEDIRQIKKPIAGYIGGISSRVDLELITYCARRLKNWSFVLVGPVTSPGVEKILLDIPNIYLPGLKPYKYIPYYINVFDICLIPFKLDEWGNYSDPLKLYEYFSIGKPVVSTNISVMKELDRVVYVGKDKDGFIEKIKQAYAEKNIGIETRINFAKDNSWDKRVNKLLTYLY